MKSLYIMATALISGSIMAAVAVPSQAQLFVGIQVGVAPPPLPVYVQPPLPGPDYIWTPGYWAWDSDARDYYWVPGAWVRAPRPGYLWTPGYWGWSDGFYVFHAGYWGPHIGYYGGVAYGFGYTGFGFEGGYWSGPHYFYNRSVNNVTNVNITNVYNKTEIVNRTTVNHVSYSGGPGGVIAQPSAQQLAAEHESHLQATPMQAQHVEAARANRLLFASANHGAPPVAATSRPAQLSGAGVVPAQRAPDAPTRPQAAHEASVAPGLQTQGARVVAGQRPQVAPRSAALSGAAEPLRSSDRARPEAAVSRERTDVPEDFRQPRSASAVRPPAPRPAPPSSAKWRCHRQTAGRLTCASRATSSTDRRSAL